MRICIGGITGWVGRALAEAIGDDPNLTLAGGVSRSSDADGVFPDVASALASVSADAYIDYTHAGAVKANVLASIEAGVPVVIGSSGLDEDDFAEIDALARGRGVGVVASGNFSVTAALMTRFALMAQDHLDSYEIVEVASADKPDAPSGTAWELATRMGQRRAGRTEVPIEETLGVPESRGADIAGARVHAARLPGYVLQVQAMFGMPGEKLVVMHEGGESAQPYVAGSLLAADRARGIVGLVRGLDTLLLGPLD